MSNQTRNDQSPDEKKNRPLGKSFPSSIGAINSFAVQSNDVISQPSLTTVSSTKKTPPLLSRGPEDERSVASNADPSINSGQHTAWTIKIFLN